jgi:hypothetical protein
LKKAGEIPDKIEEIFETARAILQTEILSQYLARSTLRTYVGMAKWFCATYWILV